MVKTKRQTRKQRGGSGCGLANAQGEAFLARTAAYHRQRGGSAAAFPDSLGPLISSDMTTAARTAVLDHQLAAMTSFSKAAQAGGGRRRKSTRKGARKATRRSTRNRKTTRGSRGRKTSRSTRNRKHRKNGRKQRGGNAPANASYSILNESELNQAGLNEQWFKEGEVNPQFK